MSVLGNLIVRITGDNKELRNAITGSKKQLSGFGAAVQKHSAAFMKTGAVMMGFAGAICIAAVKVGKEFDKAYSKIRTGTGKTGKILEGLKKDFRAVVKDVPNSFDEVSTAIADLNTRLGLTGKPLQDMAKQMLNLARITKTNVNTVIRTSTRLFGDWDVAVEDQAETLDLLYNVSQSTGIGIGKLADMVTTYGVQLRTVGFTMEESLALMGKWEKEGVSAEKMLGGLSMALGKFAKAQKEPEEAFRELVKNIEEATTVGKAMELGVEALGTRAGPDFALAVREGRFAVEDFVKELADSSETINSAAEDTMTLTEKFDLLKNRAKLAIEPLAKKLMDELTPALEKIIDKLGDLDEEQLENIASSVLFATKVLAIGGAFLFAMGAVGKFIPVIKIATGWMATFGVTTKIAFAGWVALAAIIALLAKRLGTLTKEFVDGTLAAMEWREQIRYILNLPEPDTFFPEEKVYEPGTLVALKDLTGGIEEVNEVVEYAQRIIKNYSDELPNVSARIAKLIRDFQDGTLSAEDFAIEVDDLKKATHSWRADIEELTPKIEEGTEYTGRWSKAIYGYAGAINYAERYTGRWTEKVYGYAGAIHYATDATVEEIAATVDYENAIQSLMGQYGFTREQAEEYYKTTREGTDDIEDQRKEVDNLISSFNTLLDTIFGGITTYNDFQEACWAVEEAEKALAEATEEYGIESVEAMKAQNNLDDANIRAIKTAFKLSTEIGATTEQQEEARKKAIELGLQYVATGEMSAKEFMEMAAQFGMSAADILEYAKENNIDIKALYKDATDAGIGNFIELTVGAGLSLDDMVKLAEESGIDIKGYLKDVRDKGIEYFVETLAGFGLNSGEIVKLADIMGIHIDTATRVRLLELDASSVPGTVKEVNKELAKIKDKKVTITTTYKEFHKSYYSTIKVGKVGGAMGGIVTGSKGGIAGSDGFSLPILTAAQGLITPSFDSGGILALLHKKEVVLNSGQQLTLAKLIFGLAEGKYGVKGGGGDEYNINIYDAVIKEDMDIRNLALEIEHELLKIKGARI